MTALSSAQGSWGRAVKHWSCDIGHTVTHVTLTNVCSIALALQPLSTQECVSHCQESAKCGRAFRQGSVKRTMLRSSMCQVSVKTPHP